MRCIAFAVCAGMCLVVLWLLIGTRSPLLVRTFQYRRSFVPLSVSLWNDLSDPVFDGVGLAGFKSRTNAFLLACSAVSSLSYTVLSFSPFHGLVVWGWGLWTDRVFSLSPGLSTADSK